MRGGWEGKKVKINKSNFSFYGDGILVKLNKCYWGGVGVFYCE